jgi:hypothetical protein
MAVIDRCASRSAPLWYRGAMRRSAPRVAAVTARFLMPKMLFIRTREDHSRDPSADREARERELAVAVKAKRGHVISRPEARRLARPHSDRRIITPASEHT